MSVKPPDPSSGPTFRIIEGGAGVRSVADPDDEGWEDLHAWVDGQLAPGQSARLGLELAGEPGSAARAMAYRAQVEGLRALYDPVLDEAIPDRLLMVLHRPVQPQGPSWRRSSGRRLHVGLWSAAAVAALSTLLCLGHFGLGGTGGTAARGPALAADRGN